MRAFRPFLLVNTLLFAATLAAQNQAQKQPDESVAPSGVTLTVNTQLVQVDVVVEDSFGKPVHGLKSSDFQLAEDKKPQTFRNFEEHVALDPAHTPPPHPVKLGPGIFTDYSPVPDNAPLTVLLIDRLNTPIAGQIYALQQLREFLAKSDPHSRVAIFGLTSRLHMLQGFTSDPAVLRDAIQHNVSNAHSNLLADGNEISLADSASDVGGSASTVASLRQFESESASFQDRLRVDYTLTAFDQIAGYLSGFPGRKNLLWLSGSFPLGIAPDPTIRYSFNVEEDFSDQVHKTANLLSRARVAVYPLDANGLQAAPILGNQTNTSEINFFRSVNQNHDSMNELASATGGKAFYNGNDLASAFADSIAAGSDYYTLTYSPTNHDDHGGFRSVQVHLTDQVASHGFKISYRRGYYLDDTHKRKNFSSAIPSQATPTHNAAPAPPRNTYALAAMQHGAPAPSDILFKVRVFPAASPETDPSSQRRILPGQANPPRTYNVDFTTLATKLDVPLGADGKHHGFLEFVTFAYDPDGKVLNVAARDMHLDMTPEQYRNLLKGGLALSQQISAPAKTQSLRIAVHDLNSNALGVVEVPLSAVRSLPPDPANPPAQ